LGAPEELRRFLFSGGARGNKALPVLLQRAQHLLLCHLCRQRLVGFLFLHALVHLWVTKIAALQDEGLTQRVVGSVVEILGGKGSAVDGSKAWASTRDNMLFNQVHPAHSPSRLPLPLALARWPP